MSAFKKRKGNSKSYEQRMEDSKKVKALQQRVAALRERERARKVEIAEKSKKMKIIKEMNEWRTAKVQVVNKLSKTRMWNKRARKTLAKMPAEVFYQKFG